MHPNFDFNYLVMQVPTNERQVHRWFVIEVLSGNALTADRVHGRH